jgi:stress-induced morphogen
MFSSLSSLTLLVPLCFSVSRPENSETHFKVVVVSHEFETIPALISRHRLVNSAVMDLLSTGGGSIHAFSIVAKTPTQWDQMAQSQNLSTVGARDGSESLNARVVIDPSPNCHGGDGSLPKRRPE